MSEKQPKLSVRSKIISGEATGLTGIIALVATVVILCLTAVALS